MRCAYMRIRSVVLMCLIVFAGTVCVGAESVPALPEMEGWQCGEMRNVQLDAASGNQGYWQERDYRTDGGISLKATLLWGSGPKFYNQPPAGTSASAGRVTYEIIQVGGNKTTIERDPVLGYSVAVNAFDKKFSLTVECGPHIDRSELLQCVEALLEGII